MNKRFFLFAIFFCLINSLWAQENIRKGQLLVQLEQEVSIEQVIAAFPAFDIHKKREVAPVMDIWLVHFDPQRFDGNQLLETVKASPLIREAQFNHILQYRATPNDLEFSSQWQYINTGAGGGIADADIDADSAWDITTGGVTVLGDTIVVCVVDDGIDIDHPDLVPNLWVNHNEVPNNGIDDDLNGYIDDYLGWNSYDNNDDVDGGFHGTPVAGIVGAKGDNNLGVAGVNWNVKMMIVAGGPDEAEAIAAYSYPLVQRRLYNQSNGAEGAFVVATNSSWGVDLGDPADYPLWCAMYDSMGKEGILSVAATANRNVNVDTDGDMPTACASNFLIAVTNTTRTDVKVSLAGYGATMVDLGAPGEDAYTVDWGGTYGAFGGTSAASPHVAGAVGLLYAAPCAQLMLNAKSDPDIVAGLVKQFILDGVDPNASLNGITLTGGRLNLYGAMMELLQFTCDPGGCPAPFALKAQNVNDTAATLTWGALPSALSFKYQYRMLGDTSWISDTTSNFSASVNGLMACTLYEYQAMAACDTSNSSYSPIFTFKTDGCCETPDGFKVINKTDTSVTLTWNSVLAANSYTVQLNAPGSNFSMYPNITQTPFTIENLSPCGDYSVQISTVCDTGATPFSAELEFTTTGCGACLDATYCAAVSEDASEEWIANVTLKDINNTTGTDDGYGDYRNLSTDLMADSTYTISMTPDFDFFGPFDEYFKAWIDYNQDGDFDDTMELVFDAGGLSDVTVSGTFTVPSNIVEGATRLRVMMLFDEEPFACDTLDFGEIEDYCVNLLRYPVGIQSTSTETIKVFPNPFKESFAIQLNNDAPYKVEVFNLTGISVYNSEALLSAHTISSLNWAKGVYLLKVTTNNNTFTQKIVKY